MGFKPEILLWEGYSTFYLISFQTNGSPGLEKCPTPPPTAEKGRVLSSFHCSGDIHVLTHSFLQLIK